MLSEEQQPLIKLSEMLKTLRAEMEETQAEGADSDVRFVAESVEVELNVVVTRAGEVGGGVKFWVYNAEAKGTLSDALTQSIKLKLKPVNRKTGKATQISTRE